MFQTIFFYVIATVLIAAGTREAAVDERRQFGGALGGLDRGSRRRERDHLPVDTGFIENSRSKTRVAVAGHEDVVVAR